MVCQLFCCPELWNRLKDCLLVNLKLQLKHNSRLKNRNSFFWNCIYDILFWRLANFHVTISIISIILKLEDYRALFIQIKFLPVYSGILVFFCIVQIPVMCSNGGYSTYLEQIFEICFCSIPSCI